MVKTVNSAYIIKSEAKMTYVIELDGEPPKEPVILSKDLCRRLLLCIKDVDKDLYCEFLKEFKRSTKDKWGIPKSIRDKIPPYLDESEVCFRRDIYSLMAGKSNKKELLERCLKSLPKSEVISYNPVIITKLGLALLKDRMW